MKTLKSRTLTRVGGLVLGFGLLTGCVSDRYSAAPDDWVSYTGTPDHFAFEHPDGWLPFALRGDEVGVIAYGIKPTHPENFTIGTFKPDQNKETECALTLHPLSEFGAVEEIGAWAVARFEAEVTETSLIAGKAEILTPHSPASDFPLIAQAVVRHMVIGQRRRTSPIGTTTSGISVAWLSFLQVWSVEDRLARLVCGGPRHMVDRFEVLGMALGQTLRPTTE